MLAVPAALGRAGGLALLTKAPAGYLPIYFALVGAVMLVDQRRRFGRTVSVSRPRSGAWWPGGVAGVVYVLLFPALWEAPVQRVGNLITFLIRIGLEPHPSNFFLGQATRAIPAALLPGGHAAAGQPGCLIGVAGWRSGRSTGSGAGRRAGWSSTRCCSPP